jgi:predicted PurR-regulated permease PerM
MHVFDSTPIVVVLCEPAQCQPIGTDSHDSLALTRVWSEHALCFLHRVVRVEGSHVLSLDDRTGNVLTTIGLFAAVAWVAFAARATLVAFVIALLLAYVLEPVVAWVQGLLPARSSGRTCAIALVYSVGIVLVVGAGYAVAPSIASQLRRLDATLPDMIARFTDRAVLRQHSTEIANAVERTARAVAAGVAGSGSLLMVPVIAVLFLSNRENFIDGTVELFARRRDRASVTRTIQQIDTTLAQYTRAQLATAGLSTVFYSGSMAVLGFPYAMALGILGGALEFLPIVGWILAAATILICGWLAHAHWIWMAGLIVIWRILQNLVISPRILGDRLQMEPITIIFALMAGGEIAGLSGVILSVPVAAVLRILWLERSSRENEAAA